MNIDLKSLGKLGKTIEEFNYDRFYESCVKMLDGLIKGYNNQIERFEEKGSAFPQIKEKIEKCKSVRDLFEAISSDKRYTDMFVALCLNHQVDKIIDEIKEKRFKTAGGGVSLIDCLGSYDFDMSEIVQVGNVSSTLGTELESVPIEPLRQKIYEATGLDYTSREKLMEIETDPLVTPEERSTILAQNGYQNAREGKRIVTPMMPDSLLTLENWYRACNKSRFAYRNTLKKAA